jgi:hypothetical protein
VSGLCWAAEDTRLLAAWLVRPTACRESPGSVGAFSFCGPTGAEVECHVEPTRRSATVDGFPTGKSAERRAHHLASSIAVSAPFAGVVFAVGCFSVATRNAFQSNGDMPGVGNRGGGTMAQLILTQVIVAPGT